MKAQVELSVSPRHVYKYLSSSEKLFVWDSIVSRVQNVEPLDDTRSVVYRRHKHLSRWPSWLVKPRDSCDLVSFVEKTGRRDTFAVLTESVPRPDVPRLKGTVRMSFATGGLLIEPSATTAGGTTLTYVVNANFKGRLPRRIAERVCFRQVLGVGGIQTQLAAVNSIVRPEASGGSPEDQGDVPQSKPTMDGDTSKESTMADSKKPPLARGMSSWV
ncbi:hypothetical protein PINS_up011972 [Pythium insidiosum]|nr:hypothetical protein PINS_up011972 [Pythium insidiosum]